MWTAYSVDAFKLCTFNQKTNVSKEGELKWKSETWISSQLTPITKSYNFIRSKQLEQMWNLRTRLNHVSLTNRNLSKRDAQSTAILSSPSFNYAFIDIKRCHRSLFFSTPKKYDDDDEVCIRILNFVSFVNFSSIYFSLFRTILTAIKHSLAIKEKESKDFRCWSGFDVLGVGTQWASSTLCIIYYINRFSYRHHNQTECTNCCYTLNAERLLNRSLLSP